MKYSFSKTEYWTLRMKLGIAFILFSILCSQPGFITELQKLTKVELETLTPPEYLCLRQALPEDAVILYFMRPDGTRGEEKILWYQLYQSRYHLVPRLVAGYQAGDIYDLGTKYEWFITSPSVLGEHYEQVLQTLGARVVRTCPPFVLLRNN